MEVDLLSQPLSLFASYGWYLFSGPVLFCSLVVDSAREKLMLFEWSRQSLQLAKGYYKRPVLLEYLKF